MRRRLTVLLLPTLGVPGALAASAAAPAAPVQTQYVPVRQVDGFTITSLREAASVAITQASSQYISSVTGPLRRTGRAP